VSPQDPTGAGLHGRPTAWELVDAVRTFLQAQVSEGAPGADRSDGAGRHQMRIAAHALEVVGRELALGPSQEAAHQDRLRNLGFDDDASLAEAIRIGRLDDSPELRRALREDTRDRLLVANPRWLPADQE
jgi:hypothetical protein